MCFLVLTHVPSFLMEEKDLRPINQNQAAEEDFKVLVSLSGAAVPSMFLYHGKLPAVALNWSTKTARLGSSICFGLLNIQFILALSLFIKCHSFLSQQARALIPSVLYRIQSAGYNIC